MILGSGWTNYCDAVEDVNDNDAELSNAGNCCDQCCCIFVASTLLYMEYSQQCCANQNVLVPEADALQMLAAPGLSYWARRCATLLFLLRYTFRIQQAASRLRYFARGCETLGRLTTRIPMPPKAFCEDGSDQ